MRNNHISLVTILVLMLVIVAAIIPGVLLSDGNGTAEAGAIEQDPALEVEEPLAGEEAEEVVANCRFGAATKHGTNEYQWLDELGAGWWLDFSVNYEQPASNGAEYLHVIWAEQKKDANGNYLNDYDLVPTMERDSLGYLLLGRPGRMWIVGNEVDRAPNPPPDTGPGQGDTYPQMYARMYHEVYHYIKQWDPTALVAPSALVQFTPGREQYLDIVYDTYKSRYGKAMPVDFWNMHLYILPERKPDGRANNIASVALGTDPALGIFESGGDSTKCSLDNVYCLAEHDSMAAFRGQIVRMRTWMKDHGYQNYPLLITEYSLLYKYEENGGSCAIMDEFGNCFTPQRVRQFAEDTFDYLLNTTDPDLGYPNDNNKLVQQWMWYSVYQPDDFAVSNLIAVDSEPPVLTEVGELFRSAASASATVNLLATEPDSDLGSVIDGTVSVGLSVVMHNNGNTRVDEPITVTFYRDAALTQVIASTTVPAPDANFTGMTGCATRGLVIQVDAEWQAELSAGDYPFWVKVDSGGAIDETSEADNVVSGTYAIVELGRGVFAPLIMR